MSILQKYILIIQLYVYSKLIRMTQVKGALPSIEIDISISLIYFMLIRTCVLIVQVSDKT